MSRSQIFDDNQLLVYAQQSVTPHKGYRIQSHKTVQSVRASMNGPRQQSQKVDMTANVRAVLEQVRQTIICFGTFINKAKIYRDLERLVRAERFQFGNLILQGLKESPAATQLEQKECHERLLYELRKIRDMVQDIVCRKSRQEIAIKERNIRHYDEIIRQQMDLADYYQLISPFCPNLVPETLDIIHEYHNIGAPADSRSFNETEEAIYSQLSQSTKRVSELHSNTCRQMSACHFRVSPRRGNTN